MLKRSDKMAGAAASISLISLVTNSMTSRLKTIAIIRLSVIRIDHRDTKSMSPGVNIDRNYKRAVDILYLNDTYLIISTDKNIKYWHLDPG